VTLHFGTDGVRGVAITEFTPADALRLGAAAVVALGCDRLLIARDTRRSGSVLEAALAAGAAAAGARVELLGVLPTPALAHRAQVEGAAAAMVTASHNPFADNGVKVFAAGGRKLADEVETRIEALLHADALTLAGGADVGEVAPVDGAIDGYVAHVVETFGAGSLAGMRLVLDCANGAMSAAAPAALQGLGADVEVIHAAPDGVNINDGCGATAPAALAAEVVRTGAEMGLAFDGDGDRVIAVDHTGTVVDGDRLIALSALDLRSRGELAADTVVVTVMTNLGFHRAMAAAGIKVVTTSVGDRNVLIALEQGGYSLGGEQSGHLIYPALATTGDGLLAGLVVAELVRRSGRPLAELAGEVLVSYPQVLQNVRTGRLPAGVAVGELLAAEIAAAEAELGADGRVLVRASGTEALVRVMVEAPTRELAESTATHLSTAVAAKLA
jgi:phosphoglucosamine mutase